MKDLFNRPVFTRLTGTQSEMFDPEQFKTETYKDKINAVRDVAGQHLIDELLISDKSINSILKEII